jgi:death-on-curing protein
VTDSFWYPSVEDVLHIHEDIVSEYPDTSSSVQRRGDIEFALEYVSEGSFGEVPETVHEKTFHLLRLLVANHPFVDGNKRTSLNTTTAFYLLNGHRFDYDDEIRAILKQFGTDETAVEEARVLEYFRTHTTAVGPDEARRELVLRAAKADRDEHRDIYDALETE